MAGVPGKLRGNITNEIGFQSWLFIYGNYPFNILSVAPESCCAMPTDTLLFPGGFAKENAFTLREDCYLNK